MTPKDFIQLMELKDDQEDLSARQQRQYISDLAELQELNSQQLLDSIKYSHSIGLLRRLREQD
jgi:hypothetical protein